MTTKKKTNYTTAEYTGWLGDHLIMIFFLLGLNLIMSMVVRQVGSFVINQNIFFVPAELWIVAVIVVVTSWFCFYLKFTHNYPVSCVLILAGVWSNLIERLMLGGVADYLDIYIALTNLADLEIWLGLLGLNFQLWMPETAEKLRIYLNNLKKEE